MVRRLYLRDIILLIFFFLIVTVPTVAAEGGLVIELATAKRVEKHETIYSVGVLNPYAKVVIKPEISGRVVSIDFEEGRMVEEGDLLLRFDQRIQEANLKDAEAKYLLAKQNVERLRAARGGSTLQMLDTAEATFLQAEADLEIAHTNLDKMRLTAPFTGIVGLKNIEEGDYIQAGTDIVTLTNTESLKLEFNIPERVAHVAKIGQRVHFSIDNFPFDHFTATVYAISPEIEQEGRSLRIRAHYDNSNQKLIAGMFARLLLKIPLGYEVVTVPEEAVFALEGQHYLYIAKELSSGEYRAELVEITIGERSAHAIEILEGLEGGELVVKSAHMRLKDGDSFKGALTPSFDEDVKEMEG